MLERQSRPLRPVIDQAVAEARSLQSPRVEAEHLLLALVQGDGPLPAVLRDGGLSRATLVQALQTETTDALYHLNIDAAAYEYLAPLPIRPALVALATSAKRAIERGRTFAKSRRELLSPGHVLVGVLCAKHGTVPRALRLAGVDGSRLRAGTLTVLAREMQPFSAKPEHDPPI